MILTELLQKGGIVMVPIMLLSVYVMAVVLYKAYQFWSLQTFHFAFITDVVRCVQDKKIPEALRISSVQVNPLGKVLYTVIQCAADYKMPDEQKVRVIEAEGLKQLRQYESHLRGLELVANISPLLGLLGTVTGMVKAFASIQNAGARVDPSVLAGGIWESLLTTVAGLVVAIPAMAAYYILDGRIESWRAHMHDAVVSIMAKAA